MALQLFIAVNIFTVITLISGTFGREASQDVVIYPLSTYKCDDVETLVDIDINLRTKNDNGDKIVDAEFEFDFEFTENWQYIVKIDKWNNGDWDEDIFNAKGKACDLLKQYIQRVWEKLGKEIEPNLPESCGLPKGRYKLKEFAVFRDDYDIPATMFGKFRFIGTLTDESGNEIWCQVVEAEVDRS